MCMSLWGWWSIGDRGSITRTVGVAESGMTDSIGQRERQRKSEKTRVKSDNDNVQILHSQSPAELSVFPPPFHIMLLHKHHRHWIHSVQNVGPYLLMSFIDRHAATLVTVPIFKHQLNSLFLWAPIIHASRTNTLSLYTFLPAGSTSLVSVHLHSSICIYSPHSGYSFNLSIVFLYTVCLCVRTCARVIYVIVIHTVLYIAYRLM